MRPTPTHSYRHPVGWGHPRSTESDFGPEIDRRITAAVDEHEVAVILETAGVSDRVALSEHGARDVFDLAARTKTRAPLLRLPSPPREDWYPSAPIALLRGVTFTCSGLVAVALAASFAGPRAGIWVLVTCAIWIAVLQGVAFLTYLAMERGGGPKALGVAFPVGICTVAPLLACVVVLPVEGPATALVVGTALLTVSGIVLLLVADRPLWAGGLVIPVAAVSAVSLAGGPVGRSFAVAMWVVAAIASMAGAASALVGTWGVRRVPLDRADLRASAPHVLAGLGIGALSLCTAIVAARSPVLDGEPGRVWLVAALPFFVAVTLAELLVVQLRRSLLLATAELTELNDHRRLARRTSVRLWSAHLALAAATTLLATSALTVSSEPSLSAAAILPVTALFALLGSLLTAGLLLVSCDRVGIAGALLWTGVVAMAAAAMLTPDWTDRAVGILGVISIAAVVVSSSSTERLSTYR